MRERERARPPFFFFFFVVVVVFALVAAVWCVSLGEGRLGVWCLLAWRDDGELAECGHGEGKECVESEEESEAGLIEVFGAAGLYGVP